MNTKSQMGDFVSGYNINVYACTLKRRSSKALKNTHARTADVQCFVFSVKYFLFRQSVKKDVQL